jgi:hypothetical protein
MEKKTRRVGSGRKLGSYSFLEVSLAELNRIFKPDAVIVVGRKWADFNKVNGIAFKASHNVTETIGEQIEVTQTDFNVKS